MPDPSRERAPRRLAPSGRTFERLRRLGRALDAAPDLRPNVEALRLAVNPALSAFGRELEEREAMARWERGARAAAGRSSGWRRGPPQCPGCKRLKSSPVAVCEGCGFLPGAGYVGVPARTSYLDRWR